MTDQDIYNQEKPVQSVNSHEIYQEPTKEKQPINQYQLSMAKRWLARVCFMLIGISSFANPLDYLNLYNIITGLILGLLFGTLFKWFLKRFLNTFNWKFKKSGGKEGLNFAVENGLIYLIPYAVIMTIATFFAGWNMPLGFVSAGIMTVGITAAMELGKVKGKQEIKNTIATSFVCFLFSSLWTMGLQYMVKLPIFLGGLISLLKSFTNGGGLL
jgi:O-antigen/teichoic acid export membrane protein